MSRQIVAIDIRNKSVAAVLVSTGLKGTIIEDWAHEALPTGTEDASPLVLGTRALLERLEVGNASVVISLPTDQTIYRSIEIPFTDDKKIRQILPFELEPSLPVDVGNLIIDYQKNRADSHELLAVAMDRRVLQDTLDGLEACGLHPQLVLPGDYPLASALCTYSGELDGQALFLDLGTTKATLFVLAAGRIALVRAMPADVKTDAGVEALALRIRQTLTAYGNATPDEFSPKALYLSGPAFEDSDTSQSLSEALEMPGTLVDLRTMAAKIEMADSLSVSDWVPHRYDDALSLALIEAEGRTCPNFHRSGSALRNYWSNYRPYIRGPAILMLIALILALGSVLVESSMLQGRLDRINAQIEDVFATTLTGVKRVKGIDPLDQMRSEIKKLQGGSIDAGENGPGLRTIDVLQQLSSLIPKEVDVKLDRLVMGNDGVTISGEAAAFNIVDDVKSRLETSDYFKTVTIASANMDKSGKMVRFKLKIEP